MHTDWRDALLPVLRTPEFARLRAFWERAYATDPQTLPPQEALFAALTLCPLAKTRVVILGQDPYPTPGHAHGLAFSVRPPTQPPPSLRNILTEIQADLGRPAHIRGACAALARGQGLGALHRRDHPHGLRAARARGLPPLGREGEGQDPAHRRLAAPHPDGGAPLAALRARGFLRMPLLLPGQRLADRPGPRPHRLVTARRGRTRCEALRATP